ncbi:iron-sulfur cluster repair di-iron protein [Rhizobiales bacterium]|uniref:iron-sulfur cluster repair di-iron protein n=1 Tax=Ensifer sp. R-19 TaxID=3404055 RepID=UPI000DE5A09F
MIDLSLESTVATIAAELPGAAELFRRYGISFCCGGKMLLSEAALKAGIAPSALLTELETLKRSASRDAPEETADLIAHLLHRYHQTHRAELAWLIPLAQKVERVHVGHPSAPVGLSQALEALRDELESHMMKEELVLFPMMQRGDGATISYPIAQMRREHDDEVEHLRTIEHVTHGLSLPDGACGSWAALYTGLRKLTDDLVTHMHLENAVLFPRFEAGLQTI